MGTEPVATQCIMDRWCAIDITSDVEADNKMIVLLLEQERARLQKILNRENPLHDTYRKFQVDYDVVDGLVRRFRIRHGL